MYGHSKTQTTGKETVTHIARDPSVSLCGVPLTGLFLDMAGWNLCVKCWYINEKRKKEKA